MRLLPFFILLTFYSAAQEIDVEYDKTRDLSKYKTFMHGESEVMTPKDQRQVDAASLQKMVRETIGRELTAKGMQQTDSAADLVVSFVVGSQDRSDFGQLGPLGMSPGSSAQSWSRDFRMGSLIMDLNDRKGTLIWRVNATTSSSSTDIQQMINQVVAAGFKKFSLKPKKVKKQKS